MASTIINLQSMQGMGILANRNSKSESLGFRRYNLIYGFNGSGKSTLSRLFCSLQDGELHSRLPENCSFEVSLDDGASLGWPSKPSGLQRRIMVFNSDFIEKNLQWSTGKASPVFFIGANQADAAAELSKVETSALLALASRGFAEEAEKNAEKSFAAFKRDRAKLTASHLHLGNRKYEAPALAKDFAAWKDGGAKLLADAELKAAEEIRRLDEPMPRLKMLEFDTQTVETAYRFTVELCGQSLTTVALHEVQHFPEMLVWLKDGHEFHSKQELETCLYCGNTIGPERKALLTSALDDRIDEFVNRLTKTAERLETLATTLASLRDEVPASEAVNAELRQKFRDMRQSAIQELRNIENHIKTLQDVLALKRERPATPVDLSSLAPEANIAEATLRLHKLISSTNKIIELHNKSVENFSKAQEDAEISIRQHFLADCLDDFVNHTNTLEKAHNNVSAQIDEVNKLNTQANELRRKIREHGPAAEVINKLIASYLGHRELSIEPLEEGYQIVRYGQPIHGTPSEGEKTAIAISYFLSSIEAEGRKLRDMIVVVDDPVSSLDTRALNFACSLVRGRLQDAAQLFVLTHNLQCMNEFRKAWKAKAKPNDDKQPTANFLFIDVSLPNGADRRTSTIQEMPRLLREYDSEYHFLFSYVLKFVADPIENFEYGYMMPNVLRRVLDVFLAFKCPGSSGLVGQILKLCTDYPELDRDRMVALERLSQVESHSDNLDDLLSLSSMTIEESREAALVLIETMTIVDPKHLASLRHLCR